MLRVENLYFDHNQVHIFDGASFYVGEQDKVGLVGRNGAGKTTLFKLLTHEYQPINGRIEVQGTTSMVSQEVKYDPELEGSKTIREYINPKSTKEDYELKRILHGLELAELSLDQLLQGLSGGQKTKLALARAFIEEPDILLLDEPTNFLDFPGKIWVSKFLSNYPKAFILVSHDIELLDKHIDKVIAINTFTKKIEEYKGNYSDYIKVKNEKEKLLKRTVAIQKKNITRMKESLEKLRSHNSKKGVRQRIVLAKRIERLTDYLPELPPEIKKIKIVLPTPHRIGEIALQVKNIFKHYNGNPILEDVSLSLLRNQRIALIGPNGAGKSTLIKTLLGLISPDAGEVYKDPNAKIGYYSQEFETLDPKQTLVDTMRENTNFNEQDIRKMLARFNFAGDQVFQTIGTLSGGGKTRLSIALLLSKPNNVLILDEPTTYLDVLSQRIILDALKGYTGAMLVVSHTEEFLSELNPSQALLLPDNSLENWKLELLPKVGLI